VFLEIVVSVSSHVPGSTSDLTLLTRRSDIHKRLLHKTDEELNVADNGEMKDKFPNHWGVLADKGYQGAGEILRSTIPKKKPKNGVLTPADKKRNERLSSDRIIVENFFGRLSGLWKVMRVTYKWGEDKYDQIMRLCVALTNYHIRINPLRAEDGDYYEMIKSRYYSQGEDARAKQLTQRQKSNNKRKARQQVDMNLRKRLCPAREQAPDMD
jgi:hypothetical protein